MTRYEKIIKNIHECVTPEEFKAVAANIAEEAYAETIKITQGIALEAILNYRRDYIIPLITVLKEQHEDNKSIIHESILIALGCHEKIKG